MAALRPIGRWGNLEPVLTVAETVDLLASPTVVEDVAGGVVEVAVEDQVAAGRLSGLASLPCVSVAHVTEPAAGPFDGFDIVLDPTVPGGAEAAAQAIRASVLAHPHSCVAVVQVLRVTAAVGIADGLAVESMAYAMLQAGPEHRAWLERRHRPSRPPGAARDRAVSTVWDGQDLIITLDRPEIRNAFGTAMRDELVEALRAASVSAARTIVLRGAGPAFCSGGDLREFGTTPDPATAHAVRSTRSAAWWAAQVAPRLRAEVHGACVGAGLELSAWARQVVATENTRWFLPEIAMGLIPGAGGTVSLPRRIGRHRTALLALTGMQLGPPEALGWGLVDRVVP